MVSWRKDAVDGAGIVELVPQGEAKLKALFETPAARDEVLSRLEHGDRTLSMLQYAHAQITRMKGWQDNPALDRLAEQMWVTIEKARGTPRFSIRFRLNSNIAFRGWRTRRAREQKAENLAAQLRQETSELREAIRRATKAKAFPLAPWN